MRPVNRGLFLSGEDVLVVADLHLGYEFELLQNGLRIPSQTGEMRKRLLSLSERLDPRELIILGDFKHNIPYVGDWEFEELEQFARAMPVETTIIKGNHDGGLESIIHADKVSFGKTRGEVRGGVGFFHGHTWPERDLLDCKYLVMGHSHPAIVLKDALGVEKRLPCFIESNPIWEKLEERYPSRMGEYNRDLKVIVLPSFNKLLGGTGFNVDKPLGPMASNCLDIPGSTVILIDGTILGKIEDLGHPRQGED